MSVPSLREFLDGEPLDYLGGRRRRTPVTLTYRAGVGVVVEERGREPATADVTEDRLARRLYWNLTRERQS